MDFEWEVSIDLSLCDFVGLDDGLKDLDRIFILLLVWSRPSHFSNTLGFVSWQAFHLEQLLTNSIFCNFAWVSSWIRAELLYL